MIKQRTLLNVRATVRGRWVRAAIYFGTAPGSHMGFWVSDFSGLRGWNVRLGRLDRCLTAFVHTRRP